MRISDFRLIKNYLYSNRCKMCEGTKSINKYPYWCIWCEGTGMMDKEANVVMKIMHLINNPFYKKKFK